ncbi:hypothetical protein [Aequorivita lipolytica]|uniref:Uncharacterized protein n=1 Tax=Aequorivita lipolytica TaxID=153267 RepID=A0A5C6YN98_9FLAO|nr:hypothetical protein [Aequorivita lipolytica]TXD68767.1 hypothetical protein ESV24_09920 [Aequorivita lipolytica]SRX52000.1 hypothetical protein AEQU2_01994 [Aequorivita lipolytica]
MGQDIKKMFENYEAEKPKLRDGHQARFEAKLDKTFTGSLVVEKDSSIPWLKIAAVAVVLFAVSFFGYQQLSNSNSVITEHSENAIVENATENVQSNNGPKLTLADISPDLKKIEEYYMTGINVQLASLKITDKNRDVVDGYMQRLAELDKEYNSLNAELGNVGPAEATVTALIDNLKLRLDLLFKLKNKLKELKNQNNEEFKAIQT